MQATSAVNYIYHRKFHEVNKEIRTETTRLNK